MPLIVNFVHAQAEARLHAASRTVPQTASRTDGPKSDNNIEHNTFIFSMARQIVPEGICSIKKDNNNRNNKKKTRHLNCARVVLTMFHSRSHCPFRSSCSCFFLFFFRRVRCVWGNYFITEVLGGGCGLQAAYCENNTRGRSKRGKGKGEQRYSEYFSNTIIWLLSKRGLSEIGFAWPIVLMASTWNGQ